MKCKTEQPSVPAYAGRAAVTTDKTQMISCKLKIWKRLTNSLVSRQRVKYHANRFFGVKKVMNSSVWVC